MNEQSYYRVSVKGITVDENNRILLCLEEDGSWEMLGGGLDHDEDPITCLKREIAEEAGLEVTYVSPSPKYFVTCRRPNADTYIANVIYEIKLKDLNFTPSDECRELRFFSLEEMKQVKLWPNVAELMRIIEQTSS